MNINEYRKKNKKELNKILNEVRGKLFVLRFQINTGKTQKYSDVKKFKREISKILTIISQKEYKLEEKKI